VPNREPGLAPVEAWVAATTGREVIAIERVHGSVANQDFVVRLADETSLVVKIGLRDEIAAEAWACRRLVALGVPVPNVVALALDDGPSGQPALILTFVRGGPTDDPSVTLQAGRWFRSVHAERVSGWGPLVVTGAGARGQYDSWSDALLADLSGIDELIGGGILDPELALSVRRCILTDDLLDYRGPGVLLHNDLKAAHLFGAADGPTPRLTAVIDWGDARAGDPLADVARLSMSGSATTEAFLAGYGRRLTPDLLDRLTRYRIVWNVRALCYEYRAGGDWFDVYLQRIRDDTQSLLAARRPGAPRRCSRGDLDPVRDGVEA
jgi:aminoglycoside phosphotransferase (APT) family kinase protein